MTEEILPRFITNHEVDPLLGSVRTRERWEREGVLPPGELISGFRSRVKIFPSLVAARLAAPKHLDQATTLQKRWAQITRAVYRHPSFAELRHALKEILGPDQPRVGITDLVVALLPDHRDVLQAFAAELRRTEDNLRALDVSVAISLAQVVGSKKNFYVVELVDGGDQREVGRANVPKTIRLRVGDWVTFEEAQLREWKREFLFPTAVLDEALARAQVKREETAQTAGAAARTMRDVLAVPPQSIDSLTEGRRLITLRDEMDAGRIGSIRTEEPLVSATEATVSGQGYSRPAFT